MWNPVTRIWRSQSPLGVKVIALSLLLVLASAAPIMLYVTLGPADGNPVALAWLFAAGAVVGHIGFLLGVLLIVRDMWLKK